MPIAKHVLGLGFAATAAVFAACGAHDVPVVVPIADSGGEAEADSPRSEPDASDAGKPCTIGSLECAAGYLCVASGKCAGEGTCAPIDVLCERSMGLQGGVCGCNGVAYESECDAYRDGTLPSATTTGCKEPAGRFTCGPRYCDPALHYCCRPGGETFGACIAQSSESCRNQTTPSCACVPGRPCRVIAVDGGTPGLELSCPSN